MTVEQVAVDNGNVHQHAGHPDREIAFFVLDGEGVVTVSDETAEVGRNSLVFVPRNTAYRFANGCNAAFRVLAVTSLVDKNPSPAKSEAIPIISPMIVAELPDASRHAPL